MSRSSAADEARDNDAAAVSRYRTATATGPAMANAPSVGLPLSFMLFGLICLAGVIGLLIMRPMILSTYHYNQYVVAATHLALLGWIASVVFGALYQLVPVMLETRLFSPRLSVVHLLLQAVGALGMVWSFWHWNLKHVGHWGSAFALGVALLLFNVIRTLIRSRRWTTTSLGIGSALGWLMLTVVAGLALATGKCSYESIGSLSSDSPLAITLRGLEAVSTWIGRFDQMSLMHTHAHLGALGCFVLLLVTFSLKLLPMFLISDVQSRRRVGWTLGLLNAALVGLSFSMALRSAWKLFFAGIILMALLIYTVELRAMVIARKRRVLDPPLTTFLWGLASLVPLGLLAGILSWPGLTLTAFTGQLENLYGFLAVFGLITTAILGMLFKILPVLVWHGTYSRHLGRAKVPALADIYSNQLVRVAGRIHGLGLVTVSTGILLGSLPTVRWGAIVLAVGMALYGVNFGLILSHRLRPQLIELPTRNSP